MFVRTVCVFSRMPRPVLVSVRVFFSLHIIIQPADVRTFIVLMQRCSQLLSVRSFDVPVGLFALVQANFYFFFSQGSCGVTVSLYSQRYFQRKCINKTMCWAQREESALWHLQIHWPRPFDQLAVSSTTPGVSSQLPSAELIQNKKIPFAQMSQQIKPIQPAVPDGSPFPSRTV